MALIFSNISENGFFEKRFFGLSYAKDRITRDETLIEKDIWRFLSIIFDLELTNQLKFSCLDYMILG
ncbi:MAG: hypothetical protein EWV47_17810 [Microcystis viridis Mv_BB_P_19951000_S68]|nr:MAG: hypothetical protein EWV47_17810 [Microcystis viridis Mv_BB_P_19951000_S68]